MKKLAILMVVGALLLATCFGALVSFKSAEAQPGPGIPYGSVAGIRFKGIWDPAALYYRNDVVTKTDAAGRVNSFRCSVVRCTIGQAPVSGPGDTLGADWSYLAQAGATSLPDGGVQSPLSGTGSVADPITLGQLLSNTALTFQGSGTIAPAAEAYPNVGDSLTVRGGRGAAATSTNSATGAGDSVFGGGISGAGTSTQSCGPVGSTIIRGSQPGAANSGPGCASGDLTIKTANAVGTGANNSGAITIDTGVATGAGLAGNIAVCAANCSSVAIARSGIPITFNGTVPVAFTNCFPTVQSGAASISCVGAKVGDKVLSIIGIDSTGLNLMYDARSDFESTISVNNNIQQLRPPTVLSSGHRLSALIATLN